MEIQLIVLILKKLFLMGRTEAGKTSIDTAVVPEVQSVQPSQPVSDTIVSINDPSSVSTDTLESVEEFDYSLKDTDVLLEETIRL